MASQLTVVVWDSIIGEIDGDVKTIKGVVSGIIDWQQLVIWEV